MRRITVARGDWRLVTVLSTAWLAACGATTTPTAPGEPYYNTDDDGAILLPVAFQVDVAHPTADKPQSKLWFWEDHWWALMPRLAGPTLWRRSADGDWQEQTSASASLAGLAAQADVHVDEAVVAVLVGDCRLQSLRLDAPTVAAVSLPLPDDCSALETATISRDADGRWWVAADVTHGRLPRRTSILVWHSGDAQQWSDAEELGRSVNEDDISVVSRLQDGMLVLWSNQNADAIVARRHADGDGEEHWSALEIIAQGGNTADDHLHTTQLDDGHLLVASKNSVDQVGQAQFVLRVRDTGGTWNNVPYADLEATREPTRPVVTHVQDGPIIEAHTVGGSEGGYIAIWQIAQAPDTQADSRWTLTPRLRARAANSGGVNDVTVPKAAYTDTQPTWPLLFSDSAGQVYELDLKRYRDRFDG